MSVVNPFYQIRKNKLQISIIQNMDFPEHLHDHTEIIFVLEDQMEVNIGGIRRLLSAGDCAVIFPEQIHSYNTPAASKVQLLIFDNSFTGSFLYTIQRFHPSNPFLTADALPEDVKLVFEKLIALTPEEDIDLCKRNDETEVLTAAWIQVLLALIMPLLKVEKNKKPESMDLTFRLVAYMMEHFQEPLTLEVLAREMHVNKYYLSHIFSNRLQMDFRQYLNRIRIGYAMQLIESSGQSLTEIWMEAGFNSQRSFNRIFHDVTQMTPMEYRKRYR